MPETMMYPSDPSQRDLDAKMEDVEESGATCSGVSGDVAYLRQDSCK